MFGDSAYYTESNLSSYATDTPIFNAAMKSIRIEIEWNYGISARLFPLVGNKQKLKLLKSKYVHYIYTVATILRNLHVGLYGSQSMIYFDLTLPATFLEMYMKQEK
jgi:hypothetical protein